MGSITWTPPGALAQLVEQLTSIRSVYRETDKMNLAVCWDTLRACCTSRKTVTVNRIGRSAGNRENGILRGHTPDTAVSNVGGDEMVQRTTS